MRYLIVPLAIVFIGGCGSRDSDVDQSYQYQGRSIAEWAAALADPETNSRRQAADAFLAMGPTARSATDRIAAALEAETDPAIAVRLAVAMVKGNSSLSSTQHTLVVTTFQKWLAAHPYSPETVLIAELDRAPALGASAAPVFEKLYALADPESSPHRLSSKEKTYANQLRQKLSP